MQDICFYSYKVGKLFKNVYTKQIFYIYKQSTSYNFVIVAIYSEGHLLL